MSASEPIAFAINTLMPTLKLTWEAMPSGDRLRGNFLYCLADADGELRPPKGNEHHPSLAAVTRTAVAPPSPQLPSELARPLGPRHPMRATVGCPRHVTL